MKTLTVATLKGGNAKTTTSLAIAAVLAEKGHPVALVDADPQSTATMILGLKPVAEPWSSEPISPQRIRFALFRTPGRIEGRFGLAAGLDTAEIGVVKPYETRAHVNTVARSRQGEGLATPSAEELLSMHRVRDPFFRALPPKIQEEWAGTNFDTLRTIYDDVTPEDMRRAAEQVRA